MTLATAYFIIADTVTISVHLELSRCLESYLIKYLIMTGVFSTLFILGLIVSFMYLTKNYSTLFLKNSESFRVYKTFDEDLN